ncbi:transferrin-binding protein-like solute binding protein [Phaeospirillum tilakii]|uniref:Transferrin-binding protein-like solute binding protein n=1 Tax=Phaeospirillum tilakii TaxID=741673 RepID=A0ABW5CFT9_9PROT
MAPRPLLATAAALTALAAPLAPAHAQIAAGTGVQIGSAGGVHGEVQLAAASFDASNRAIGHRIGSGEPIYQGDLIATGPGGGLQVLLVDQTVFSIGENARMTIDALNFDPASSDGKIDFNVEQGSFRFVSGQIAAAHPENVTIRIPEGSIGIRGTIVGGVVGPGATLVALLGPGGDNNGGARNGAIVVTTPGGTAEISRAGFATLVSVGAPPTPPAPLTPGQIQQLNRAARPGGGAASGGSGGQGPSAASASGQATAAGHDTVNIITSSDPVRLDGDDIGHVISTGKQVLVVRDEQTPLKTLAAVGGGTITALEFSIASGSAQASDTYYECSCTASDVSTRNSYSFSYTSDGLILQDSSASDPYAPYWLLLDSETGGVRRYSTGGDAYWMTIYDYANASGLSYSTYGTWRKKDNAPEDYYFGTFWAGVVTPATQMPTSGTATYNGGAAGYLAANYTKVASITGTAVLTANFSSGTIAGTLNFNSASNPIISTITSGEISSVTVALDSASFKGGNSFTGTASLSSAGVTSTSGSYTGTFYGTSAAEVAGGAQVRGTTTTNSMPVTVTAAYGAKK